jgi:predicted RNA-binding Zn ribbon-like protein
MRDLERARSIRDALRALAAHNSGDPVSAQVLRLGSEAMRELPVELRFVASGSPLFVEGTGVDRYLADLVASHVRAQEQHRWSRVKLCASTDCRWAYWDNSRNVSRRWCSMGVCGSRSKMRDYRRHARVPD